MARQTPTFPIEISQGSDVALAFVYKIGQTAEDAEPVNLTGSTARMTIWTRAGDQLLLLTTENGGIVLGGATGTIAITISDEDTYLLTQLRLRYLIELISPNPDNLVWPFLRGEVIVTWRVPA